MRITLNPRVIIPHPRGGVEGVSGPGRAKNLTAEGAE